MKIALLANRDIASNFALNILLKKMRNIDFKIFLSEKIGNSESIPQRLKDLGFFEQQIFNDIVFPLVDAAGGTKNNRLASFTELEELTQQEMVVTSDINDGHGFAALSHFGPDLIISIRFGIILKKPVISLPKYGVINLHSGRLPSYQGVMATFRAMLNDEPSIGATLHYIDDASIDTGRIINNTGMPINKNRSYFWHVLNLYPDACAMVLDAIEEIRKTGYASASDQKGEASYYSFPTESELDQFQAKGLRLWDVRDFMDFFRNYVYEASEKDIHNTF